MKASRARRLLLITLLWPASFAPAIADPTPTGADAFPEERAAMDALRDQPTAANRARLAALRFVRAVQLTKFARERDDLEAFELATAYAESATALDPERANYWFLYGRLLSECENNPRALLLAESALRKSLELDPRQHSVRLLLGQLYFDQARFDAALREFEAAVRADEAFVIAPLLATMCEAYLVDYQWERGIRFYRAILRKRPGADSARLALAVLLHERREVEAAVSELESVMTREGAPAPARQYAQFLKTQWVQKAFP